MNNEKRLYIVTVRLEFQYPVLADSVAAACSGSTIRAAVEDLSVVPWKSTVDRAWPNYKAPEGYEQRSLVYARGGKGRWRCRCASFPAMAAAAQLVAEGMSLASTFVLQGQRAVVPPRHPQATSPGIPKLVEAQPFGVTEPEDASEHIITHGLLVYGPALQEWSTREELEQKLDAKVADSRFRKYLGYLQQFAPPMGPGQEGRDAFLAAYTHFTSGRAPARTREFARLGFAGCQATARLTQSAGARMPRCGLRGLDERLDDIATPADYVDSILAGLRASACELALVAAFDTESNTTTLSEERLDMLLDVACVNQRAWLRLIAGVAAAEVPEDIVPLDERIDWDALVDTWDHYFEEFRRFEDMAAESPRGVFSERDLCFACTEELAFGPVGWNACKSDWVTGVDAEVLAAVTAGDVDGIELGSTATTDAAKEAT